MKKPETKSSLSGALPSLAREGGVIEFAPPIIRRGSVFDQIHARDLR
jgi:hypothetical protein